MKATPCSALHIVVLALLSLSALPASAAPTPVPRGAEIRINTPGNGGKPSVAAFQDGSFVVAWTSQNGLQARFLDRRGRPTSSEVSLRMGTLEGGFLDQVVTDRDGSFLVVVTGDAGRGRSDVFLRRFNRNGTPKGQLFRANAPARPNRDNAMAAIGRDGRIAVAWSSTVWPNDEQAYGNAVARIFSAKGNPLTKEIVLKEGRITGPGRLDYVSAVPQSLAFAPDGTLSVLVGDSRAGCLRNFLVRRAPGGSISRQNLNPACTVAYLNPNDSLAMGLDGSLVALWSRGGIVAGRFSPQGALRGEAFPVSEDPAENQRDPGVALQAGGSFVAVWIEANGQDGGGQEIFGRAFAPNGTPRTGNFLVNTTTEGARYLPVIAAAREGNVLVVWIQQTGLEVNILARLLSANQ